MVHGRRKRRRREGGPVACWGEAVESGPLVVVVVWAWAALSGAGRRSHFRGTLSGALSGERRCRWAVSSSASVGAVLVPPGIRASVVARVGVVMQTAGRALYRCWPGSRETWG